MSAPNALRVGSKENVFVEAQEYTGAPVEVTITAKEFPAKLREFLNHKVTLNSDNSYQALQEIMLKEDFFDKDSNKKQFVYLEAKFPQHTLQKVVLLSFQSGFIFVQTDKTIYTPTSKVHYRLFATNPSIEPIENDISVEMMTPDGIIVFRDQVFPNKGVQSGVYELPEVVSVGTWKVVAKFQKTPQRNFTYEFEVKEYVLPTFEVKLIPRQSFFYVDDRELTVDITAKYLYGKDVTGKAFVVFGVMTQEGKKSFPGSLQRVDIIEGKGTATLKREHIVQISPDINQLLGLPIYVTVNVLTRTGTEMVEAEKTGILIVTSPYTIHFKKTPKFFKPGMPFVTMVYVTNPDDSPAAGIRLKATPGPVHGVTKANGMARLTVNTGGQVADLRITIQTEMPALSPNRQAQQTMVAKPYQTYKNTKNYLHIGIQATELEIGDIFEVNLNLANDNPGVQNEITQFTYLVVNKGQIVLAKRQERKQGQSLVTLTLPVTKDMVPSFRFVAYYHLGADQVVSDSVWVDVKDTCVGKLKVTSTRSQYEPRKSFTLSIEGDPGAKVGLVAVDKGVYVLNSKHRLSQSKIWDIVEKHDVGCTAGSGQNSMEVFYDAGLMFLSNGNVETRSRSEPDCPSLAKRRRRGSEASDDDYFSDRDTVSHIQLPESWLWQELMLPNCPPQNPRCTSTSHEIKSFQKDTITTWEVTAIGLSGTHGICMADPFEMTVMKNFFIDLKLPYSAVRNEQLEIKAVLYNYVEDNLKVRVDLMETENVCSAASKKRRYREEVEVPPMSSVSVPFVIIPMAIGEHSIEVNATIYDSDITDGVKKNLRVVSEGMRVKKEIKTIVLDPTKHNGKQFEMIKGTNPHNQVPGSPAETYITVTGELLHQTIQEAISGSPLGNLIMQPSGSGEQNMIGLTGPVIATHYLDNTGQWEKAGVEKRETAIKYIGQGYVQELTYRKTDGSYAPWKGRPSSTWLTAYVTKVFSMAYKLISIEEDVICSAAKWLILNAQQADGSFKEDAPGYHTEMMGNVRGKDADASLTAFVLIALQEAQPICGVERVASLPDGIKKAQEFLSRRINSLTNSYAVAMTSYALANEGQNQLDILFKFASPDKSHWPDMNSHLFTLEATGYALLTLVKAKEFDKAGKVVEWLTQQRFYGGGYGSTQATIIVFQAVAQYHMDVGPVKDIDLFVDISVAGRSRPIAYTFNKNNAFLTRSLKTRVDQDLNITATGVGQGTVSVMTLYNTIPTEEKQNCKNFELAVKLTRIPAKNEDVLETYKLEIDVGFLSTERDATMSILDITLLTGFVADEEDLRALTRGKDRYVQKFEMDKQLSEKGSLILYMDKVSRNLPDRVVFRMHKMQKIGLIQPAAVTVYEYYAMENRCTKFYHPEKKDGALNRICHDDVCRCAEENCSMQKKLGKNRDLDRITEACTAEVDYVYKVQVVRAEVSDSLDRFTIKILEVIKEGTDTEVQWKERMFISHPYCREAINLLEKKMYLLMGKSAHLIMGEGKSMTYMVGDGTWIEYWPTPEECQMEKYQQTCLEITNFTNDLFNFGCPN
ncbi:complement C3-like [Scleropages formosus]|uniref:complement C3-like n=1 Tax=Scleropages formosus TaxID=113540 RepID=UPI0010FA7911|nr:complement C3 [Scleropages formosus]